MGKCSLHLASESRASGHSVQNAAEERHKENPTEQPMECFAEQRNNMVTRMINEDQAHKDVRLSASQCFLMAAGVKCKKFGTCKTTTLFLFFTFSPQLESASAGVNLSSFLHQLGLAPASPQHLTDKPHR